MIGRMMLVGLAVLAASGAAASDHGSDEWGGGRMFFEGHEIRPPLQFSGFGGWDLFANGIRVDPLPCEPYSQPDPKEHWCGNRWDKLPSDPLLRRIAEQDLAVERLLALSSLPLVMIGCDYFYRPDSSEAAEVLFSLEVNDYASAIEAGVPPQAARDLRRARESSE